MAPAIRLRSAVALVGRFPVLAGADLEVGPGEVALVHGPNGAGKTSLLRACAGLLPLTDGHAEVLGHDLRSDRRAVRRSVALLGHATFLYDDLTVAEQAAFAARAFHRPAAAADDALARLGLERRAGVQIARLSAGQRRRLALACLVARDAELWLLDEPHAGLDAANRDVVDALIRDRAASGGTVVLASHELDRARAVADRSFAIAGGRVQEDACVA
ncbi:MAG: type transport system ATP-binding protein [Actinomycetota bacterium]|nr:type transport system ATP-binding protein [Actinomycetota bacterium]